MARCVTPDSGVRAREWLSSKAGERLVNVLIAISATIYIVLWLAGFVPWGMCLLFELSLCFAWDCNSPEYRSLRNEGQCDPIEQKDSNE
jgi:hypothetical protein